MAKYRYGPLPLETGGRSSWATATGAGVLDIGSIIGRIASGGVGGSILMMIVGLIKQAVEQKAG